jgi:myosin heavy subunit
MWLKRDKPGAVEAL